MTEEMLHSFAHSRGYKPISNNTVVGVHRGYPFVSTLTIRKLSVLNAVITTAGRFPGKLGKVIRRQLPKGCSFLWNPRPTLVCSGKDDDLFGMFTAAMDAVTSALQEADVSVPDKCPFCKQDHCDALALIGGAYQPAHRTCCQERSYSVSTDAEMNDRQGSYFTGLIGAVLGGILATLPSLATTVWMERIYAALFFLIPLGVYYGYKLFRGKMDKTAGVISVIVSLAMPFVLEMLVFYVSVAKEFHILPSIFATSAWYFDLYTPGEMVASMAMPYVFVIFGIAVTFKQITRTSANDVADAGNLLESMTSFGSGSFAAYDCDSELHDRY